LVQVRTGVLRLAGTLKQLCRPEALDFIEQAAQLPGRVDLSAAQAVGPWGLFWALGDDDIKKGLGVVLELTRGLASLAPSRSV
jgi:uncharacterized protein YjgD (DUF1641 family)